MSNTWNQSGTTWGQNQWGDQADVDVALTGVQSTSSVGTISPADVMGLTGVQSTSSVGTAIADQTITTSLTGVQSASSVGSTTVDIILNIDLTLTGLQSATSIGSVTTSVEQTAGWGQDTWGAENWGESSLDVTLSGLATTSAIGSIAFRCYDSRL